MYVFKGSISIAALHSNFVHSINLFINAKRRTKFTTFRNKNILELTMAYLRHGGMCANTKTNFHQNDIRMEVFQ